MTQRSPLAANILGFTMTWLSILRDLFYTMMGANVPQVTSTSTERVGLSTIKSTTNPSDAERVSKSMHFATY